MRITLSSFILIFFLHTIAFSQVTSLNENFSNCINNLPAGWQQYSVTGSDAWDCTNTGYTNKGVYMNGYSGGGNNANEDWLISPSLDFSTFSQPSLSFISRTKFAGNAIQLMVSTNYAGSGNPNAAVWTTLPAGLPAPNSDYWMLTENVDLTSYKNQPFYISFKYTSTAAAAALWRVDDVNVVENALTANKKFVNAGQCAAGSYSNASSFSFTMTGLSGTLTADALAPFQLSKDNVSFSTQLSYTAAASGIPQTVYVRVTPTVAEKVYRDSILFTYNGHIVKQKIYLLGTSLPDDKTLRVANWNMRWFGEPSWCNCDTSLAKANAKTILQDMNADLYCIQELVNINQLSYLTTSLGPNYQYAVAPFGSGALNPQSGLYATCQKNAFIYNTNKIQNLGTFGLLASTYPNDTSAYYCFSSGRFPFVMKAKLLLANAGYDTVIFSNIHAKASDTQSDYDRRLCGAQKMTDSLNTLFANNKIIVLGDYNDYLEGSAVTGNVNSPYKYLLDNGYTGISLPSKYPGQSTYVGSTNHIIDNVVYKNNLSSSYVDSSFFIFTETNKYISDYKNSTSDHYPCMSYFRFNFPNSIAEPQQSNTQTFFTILNPSSSELRIKTNHAFSDKPQLNIYDLSGKKIYTECITLDGNTARIKLPEISAGIYFVELETSASRAVQKWLVQ